MTSILRQHEEPGDAPSQREHGLAYDVLHGLIHDHSFHYAAGTAFRAVLAIFPLLIGLVALLALTGDADRAHHVLETIGRTDMVPQRTVDSMRSQLDDLDEPGPNLALGAIAAFAFALWSGAAAFRTVMSGLNRAFDMHDQAGLVRRFIVSLALAALTSMLALAATFLVAEGPVVEHVIEALPGGSGAFRHVWDAMRFPVIGLLVFAWLSITYAWGPADRRDLRFVTPGIIIAFLMWLAFALLFSWYVDDVSSEGDTYGSFAGLVVFQLYMYWSALIIFVGAQVDNALGRRGR
jgi:membrane protein